MALESGDQIFGNRKDLGVNGIGMFDGDGGIHEWEKW
jgi:hypothetical protein